MTEKLHITKVGKLRIYMGSGEALRSESLLRRMFPRSKYLEILRQAKASGIRDAHVFRSHATAQKGGRVTRDSLEGHTSGVTVCVELVDERAKLETFFKTHSDILKGNTVIYKEVEYWEYKE